MRCLRAEANEIYGRRVVVVVKKRAMKKATVAEQEVVEKVDLRREAEYFERKKLEDPRRFYGYRSKWQDREVVHV